MLSGTDTLIDTQSRGLQCHHRPYGQISHLQLPATATTPVQTTAKMCNCTRACCSKHTVLFRNMKVACQNKSHLSSCSKSVAYQVLSRSWQTTPHWHGTSWDLGMNGKRRVKITWSKCQNVIGDSGVQQSSKKNVWHWHFFHRIKQSARLIFND